MVGESKIHAEGEIVHTGVTGDTGQWTSRHWQANELNISNLMGRHQYTPGFGRPSRLAPGGTTFFFSFLCYRMAGSTSAGLRVFRGL